jgi:hypothetical protein
MAGVHGGVGVSEMLFLTSMQKQILLLRISHEISNRPEFGNQYQSHPDSLVRQWVARCRALMGRLGVGWSSRFEVSWKMCPKYWDWGTKSMIGDLIDAAEQLKLDLELSEDSNMGRIYDERSQHSFYSDFTEILSDAKSKILIVDPYFDGESLQLYGPRPSCPQIDILCGKYAGEVNRVSKMIKNDTGIDIRVKCSKGLHDRVILIDSAIVTGTSNSEIPNLRADLE